jgi:hypothetical protein
VALNFYNEVAHFWQSQKSPWKGDFRNLKNPSDAENQAESIDFFSFLKRPTDTLQSLPKHFQGVIKET